MGKMMHNHTVGHGILQQGEHELSILYRKKLLEMQKVVAKLYDKYSDTNGLLRYSDLATYNIGNKTIFELRRMLDDAFDMRADIIKHNLRRGTAEQYHDVLYQVEKHARAAKLNNDILNVDIAATGGSELDSLDDMIARSLNSPGKGPDGNDIPTWEETIKKRNAESLNMIKKAFQAPLSSEGITLEQHMKSIQNALSRDAGLMIRVQHTYGNKLVNQATTAAFESRYAERVKEALQQQNEDIQIVWRHDDPEEPRRNHVDLDGTPADENGEWHTNGYSAKGPGQFGVPSEDINCKCYLTVNRVNVKSGKVYSDAEDGENDSGASSTKRDLGKRLTNKSTKIKKIEKLTGGYVDLDGIHSVVAGQIIDGLKAGPKVKNIQSLLIRDFKDSTANAICQSYENGSCSIFLNKKYIENPFGIARQKNEYFTKCRNARDRYNYLLENATRQMISTVSDRPVFTTILHEKHHAIYRSNGVIRKKFIELLKSNGLLGKKTEYARVSYNASINESELFAEIGAAFHSGIDLPPEFKIIYNELWEKKS